jgi:hypothetical protein
MKIKTYTLASDTRHGGTEVETFNDEYELAHHLERLLIDWDVTLPVDAMPDQLIELFYETDPLNDMDTYQVSIDEFEVFSEIDSAWIVASLGMMADRRPAQRPHLESLIRRITS